MRTSCDYLVIGSGIAGLSYALEACKTGQVIVVPKRTADESNTKWAQGGIAAVLGTGDTFEAHIQDTLSAGAGLCHKVVVDLCVRDGPARIEMLQSIGARFDMETPSKEGHADLDLQLEGEHSAPRAARAGDTTGREVEL